LQRFVEVVVHAGLKTVLTILHKGMGRQGNNRQPAVLFAGLTGPDPPGGLKAVHNRHLAIHQNQIHRRDPQHGQGLFTVGCLQYGMPLFLQGATGHQHINGIVLHHQHPGPAERCLFLHRLIGCSQRGCLLSTAAVKGDCHSKGTALTGPTDDADGAAHQLDQTTGDGQPQAGAAILAGGRAVGLHKRFKQPLQLSTGDADTGIPYQTAQQHLTVILRLGPGPQGNGAVVGKLDCIGEQVQKNLTQPGQISGQTDRINRLKTTDQQQPLGIGLGRHQFKHLFQQGCRTERQLLQLNLAGINLGKVQDIVDDSQQQLTTGRNGIHITLLLIGKRGLGQQPGHADHAVHRSTDLMTHVGQKLHLGLCRFFQRLIGTFFLGDVTGKSHRTQQTAVLILNRCLVGLHPDALAPAGDQLFNIFFGA